MAATGIRRIPSSVRIGTTVSHQNRYINAQNARKSHPPPKSTKQGLSANLPAIAIPGFAETRHNSHLPEGMMPRLILLLMVASCAGCAGGHQVAYTTPQSDPTVTFPVTRQAMRPKLRPAKAGKLTAFEPKVCQGERYDDRLLETEPNQPFLRPFNNN